MKKVAIKLDGTKEQFFKAQGYLLFLGAIGPYTQMPNDLEYILIDQFGVIGATYSEIIPDDYDVIDPFSAPNHGVLKGNDGKDFPREMLVWDYYGGIYAKATVEGMYNGRYIAHFDNGDVDIYRYAKDFIPDQPTELDQLKAENEMLKEKINRLKNLVNNEM